MNKPWSLERKYGTDREQKDSNVICGYVLRTLLDSPPEVRLVFPPVPGMFDINVGKRSLLENPFPIRRFPGWTLSGARHRSLSNFRVYARKRLEIDSVFRNAILSCRGKRLGCWCAPYEGLVPLSNWPTCHAQVIHELAEELYLRS